MDWRRIFQLRRERDSIAYKEKNTKKRSAQWFKTTAKGEKKKRRKRGFETKREALEYEWQKKLNCSRSMGIKLSEFMEVYFEDKQNDLKEHTMKNKRSIFYQGRKTLHVAYAVQREKHISIIE